MKPFRKFAAVLVSVAISVCLVPNAGLVNPGIAVASPTALTAASNRDTSVSNGAVVRDLEFGHTYSSYDITGDAKADKFSIEVAGSDEAGSDSDVTVTINGSKALSASVYTPGADYCEAKLITLANKAPFLYFHCSTINGYYSGGWVYQYSGNSMKKVIATEDLVAEHKSSYRKYEALHSVNGNSVTFRVGSMGTESPSDFAYTYKNGTLVRGSSNTVASGTWGTCPWSIDKAGVLTIEAGTGADVVRMSHVPWSGESYTEVKTEGTVVAPKTCCYLFAENGDLKTADLSGFKASAGTDISGLFSNCWSLETIYIGGNWSPSAVKGSSGVFYGCESLVGGNGTKYSSSHVDGDYARIDAKGAPGYFTSANAKSFKLQSDNNSFTHSSPSFFEDSTVCRTPNYQLSDKYYKLLVSGASDGEKDAIKRDMNETWGGSCYGVATTMALVFAGHLKPGNISNANPRNYFAMQKPASNSKLLNSIQFYQLSQSLAKGGKGYATVASCSRDDFISGLKNWLGTGGAMHDFLAELVRRASVYGGDAVVLCYSYRSGNETHGHALLATDCSYSGGRYDVKIYDENDRSAFKHMYIPRDFSGFTFVDGNRNTVTQDNYVDMQLLDLGKLKGVGTSGGLSTMASSAPSSAVTIELATNAAVSLVDAKGKTLSYDGKSLSGDMPVYSARFTSSDDSTNLSLVTGASGAITATRKSGSLDVAVIDEGNLVSASGKGIKSAVLALGSGVTMKGSKFDYVSFVSTGKDVTTGDPGLVSVSGKARADVSVQASGGTVSAKSSKKMSGLETVSYVASKAYSQSVAKPQKKVARKASSKKTVISKGAKFTSEQLKFKVSKATGTRTAQVVGLTSQGKKSSQIEVPDKVSYKGVTLKVTSVKASAFKGSAKAKSAVLGANVSSIGKGAFKGCKKLTTLTVKSKKLTKKSVRNCLQGSKVAKVKVSVGGKSANTSYAKKYAKLFTKKNAGRAAKVTA